MLSEQVTQHGEQNVYELAPGDYKEPLRFGENDIVKMQPGVYQLKGGMSLKNVAVLDARGVMLYVAPKNSSSINRPMSPYLRLQKVFTREYPSSWIVADEENWNKKSKALLRFPASFTLRIAT